MIAFHKQDGLQINYQQSQTDHLKWFTDRSTRTGTLIPSQVSMVRESRTIIPYGQF